MVYVKVEVEVIYRVLEVHKYIHNINRVLCCTQYLLILWICNTVQKVKQKFFDAAHFVPALLIPDGDGVENIMLGNKSSLLY